MVLLKVRVAYATYQYYCGEQYVDAVQAAINAGLNPSKDDCTFFTETSLEEDSKALALLG